MISTLLPPTAPPSLLPDTRGRPPRVVLDTAVVITALMFGGGPAAQLRSAWKAGRCRPMACKATALDLGAQLAHPHLGLTSQEQRQLLGDYLPYVLKVRVPQADTRAQQSEPPGLAQVRLAMAGRAHALVSGEAEMLTLSERMPFAVLALHTFVDQLDSMDVRAIPKPR
jgi:uncharacterized protein